LVGLPRKDRAGTNDRISHSGCASVAHSAGNGRSGLGGTLPVFRLPMRDRRGPTSGLEPLTCSLRVSSQALQRLAQGCKPCISRPISFRCIASFCTVLRSRWCQNGVTLVSAGSVFAASCRPLLNVGKFSGLLSVFKTRGFAHIACARRRALGIADTSLVQPGPSIAQPVHLPSTIPRTSFGTTIALC
jgi:hypothetical protein